MNRRSKNDIIVVYIPVAKLHRRAIVSREIYESSQRPGEWTIDGPSGCQGEKYQSFGVKQDGDDCEIGTS